MEINKYNNGKIYTVRSFKTDKYYIGSTCETLAKRFWSHQHRSNKCSSKEIIELDDAYIELLELYPCNSKAELNKREGELIRQHDKCINKFIAGRDRKQYKEDNKEKITEYMTKYKEDNKEQIKKQRKEYLEKNRDEVLEKMKARNKIKVKCPNCDKEYNKPHLKRHMTENCPNKEKK